MIRDEELKIQAKSLMGFTWNDSSSMVNFAVRDVYLQLLRITIELWRYVLGVGLGRTDVCYERCQVDE